MMKITNDLATKVMLGLSFIAMTSGIIASETANSRKRQAYQTGNVQKIDSMAWSLDGNPVKNPLSLEKTEKAIYSFLDLLKKQKK